MGKVYFANEPLVPAKLQFTGKKRKKKAVRKRNFTDIDVSMNHPFHFYKKISQSERALAYNYVINSTKEK